MNTKRNNPEKTAHKLSQQDIASVQTVASYLSDHYASDIPLDRLTQIACMGTTKLKTCFKKYYDCTITEYIQQRRMSQAEYLLAYTELTVGQVAQTVGYSTSSRFCGTVSQKHWIVAVRVQKKQHSESKMSARDCSLALTLLLKYQLGLYNFLRLRFQRVHQPHPAHGVTGFQFLGDARRFHHAGQAWRPCAPAPPGQSPTGAGTAFRSKSSCCKGWLTGVPSGSVAAYGHTKVMYPARIRLGFPFFEGVNRPECRTRKSHSSQWGSCSGAQNRRSCLLLCRHVHSRLSPQYLHGRIARLGLHHPSQKR